MENLISIYRRKLKVKQCNLAAEIDVSASYLCKVENGTMEPTIEIKNRCAEYFQISLEQLFPDSKVKNGAFEITDHQENKLWTVRQKKKLKQYELAKMVGCSPSYLSKIEKGLQEPGDDFKKRCAKILKVKQSTLFPK